MKTARKLRHSLHCLYLQHRIQTKDEKDKSSSIYYHKHDRHIEKFDADLTNVVAQVYIVRTTFRTRQSVDGDKKHYYMLLLLQ